MEEMDVAERRKSGLLGGECEKHTLRATHSLAAMLKKQGIKL